MAQVQALSRGVRLPLLVASRRGARRPGCPGSVRCHPGSLTTWTVCYRNRDGQAEKTTGDHGGRSWCSVGCVGCRRSQQLGAVAAVRVSARRRQAAGAYTTRNVLKRLHSSSHSSSRGTWSLVRVEHHASRPGGAPGASAG
ncbi:hypothetical protein GMORB2_1690 [Geosmithia morbida]|uniref:Uncharacterized protein n=1 Tax=Geosmithia morbida TaxID=1094350 RepID=A0A9P5D3J2_9HYPO|nr:uncharacterized protein GMORB2_1690 [Geosmithia morbida]KAF4121850.1 hypothetical protein GMORB2_1690 [Geosmithia morbida]